MITIIYNPNIKEIPKADNGVLSPTDGEINYCANNIELTSKNKKVKNAIYIVTNFLLIMELRARIVEKKINWQKIQFVFNNEVVEHNEDAKFNRWPDGFGDHYEKILDRVLA